MREKILISVAFLATFVCLLIAGIVLLVAFWKYQPVDEPYIVLNPESHVAEYVGGNLTAVTRQFKITKSVDLLIERELVQRKPDDITVRVEIPETHVHYDPGTFTAKRMFEIPDGLPPGEYELQNKVCWNQNPLRRNCLNLPKLSIKYSK